MRQPEGIAGSGRDASDGRLTALDGLRGIASLIVVFGHSMLTQPFYWHLYFGEIKPTPYDWLRDTPLRLLWASDKAVILFFVLSGFVLALPWTRGKQRPYPAFVVSRICRIYLPYLAAMILAAIFAAALGGNPIPGASEWINGFGWVNHLTYASVPSVLLMLGNGYSTWIDNPTWSLVWEMRVSLLFPLLVIPVIRWGLRGAVLVAASLWAFFTLGEAADTAFSTASALFGDPHKTFSFAGYFLLGILLAKYRQSLTRIASAGYGAGSLLLVVAAAWVWFHNWTTLPLLMHALGAAMFLVAAASNGLPRKFLDTPPIQWLGRVSYSLYLIHVPIILICEYLLYPRLSHVAIIGVAIPIALICAELFHRAVEQPAHNLGRYLARRKAASTTSVEAA